MAYVTLTYIDIIYSRWVDRSIDGWMDLVPLINHYIHINVDMDVGVDLDEDVRTHIHSHAYGHRDTRTHAHIPMTIEQTLS